MKNQEEVVTSCREKLGQAKEEARRWEEKGKECQLKLAMLRMESEAALDVSDPDQELLRKLRKCVHSKRALIYQKKYLLNVLGGFQLTEKATLALLANMSVTMDDSTAMQSPRNRFRSAVFAVIALSRMKFLVKKWSNSGVQQRLALGSKSYGAKSKTSSTSSSSLFNPGTGSCDGRRADTLPRTGFKSSHETNATLDEYVTRLQRLHQTLGLSSDPSEPPVGGQVVLDMESGFN
jgi:hypothetical protein